MIRHIAAVMLTAAVATSSFALDASRAEGSLTTDGTTTKLEYSYVVKKVHSDVSGRNDAIKIIVTDKPLPAGTVLRDVDYDFPAGIVGVVVCVNGKHQPQHLVVQHPKGVYDAGWIEMNQDVSVRLKQANGVFEGRLECPRAVKASVTFSFGVDFNAAPE